MWQKQTNKLLRAAERRLGQARATGAAGISRAQPLHKKSCRGGVHGHADWAAPQSQQLRLLALHFAYGRINQIHRGGISEAATLKAIPPPPAGGAG